MRFPFPERVPLNRVAIFAAVLFAVQTIEKTPLYFTTGCALFILISAFAFNAGGGLTRTAGVYVFAYSVLVFIIGICFKAYLGEPAQSNLTDPETDIAAYVATISGIYAAVILSRRFTRSRGLLEGIMKDENMHRASVGCILFGAMGTQLIQLLGEGAGKIQSAFNQLNQLIPLGILIGIMYEIRRSGGKRSTTPFVLFGCFYLFYLGATGFSKQGMITPLYCWLLPVCALRFRLSAVQVLFVLTGSFVIFQYLVPFSQVGRNYAYEGMPISERVAVATSLLEHPEQTRKLFLESEKSAAPGLGSYFDKPQGFWERLQFISADDKLIEITDQGKVFGLQSLKAAALNVVPHFLWPDKPGINIGNMYAHEISGTPINEGDVSTGIAFSPTAEAYHIAKWAGLLVIGPILWFTFFTSYDLLLGDLRATPWGLLALVVISHTAPEGGINGIIGLVSFGAEALIFCAFFSAWFAPLLGSLAIGPGRKKPQSGQSLRTRPAA